MNSEWIYLIQDKLEDWWVYAIRMLPNFFLALVVLIAFYVIARIARKLSGKVFLRISKSPSVSGLLSGLLYTFIVIAGIMTALDILELDKTVSSLLAGVGIIGLALGFAFQDLTSNFISGAFIALKRPFDVGHTVETNGFLGTIEEIQLRSTTLRTSAGLHVIIPNKDIFQKPIINYSRTDARRAELEFVIPNFVDAQFAERIIRDSLEIMRKKNGIYGIEFYYTAIENPMLRINVSFWTNKIEPRAFMSIRHGAITRIYSAFKDAKIYNVTIPAAPPIDQEERTTQKG